LLGLTPAVSLSQNAPAARYIVQSTTAQAAHAQVVNAGGTARTDVTVINAVIADLSLAQATKLSADPQLRVFKDHSLTTRTLTDYFTDGTSVSAKSFETNYPMLVGADALHEAGITGDGVTIAVLDTGLWSDKAQKFGGRVLASVNIVQDGFTSALTDPYGHGTHITSIAAGGALTKSGKSFGIAPEANLVIVRAFNAYGGGMYSDVIAGLNWIVTNRAKYNIRVLNLSFGAPPQSYYWDDPLNQAVMAAWKAGIVVVASAGNEGPTPMTIGVPGNVPYVITVGALTDNYTPYVGADDRLASFSSTGPTFEGFVKPEVVAPGGHMVGSLWYLSYLANIDPGSMTKSESLFTMSGTSQAAAVTSGIVALMLQEDPTLTPDTVKCRLLASASPAVNSSGQLAYSVFQQGSGLVNAAVAVNSTATGCANQGLNIAADLAGTQHFGGPANVNSSGNYYLMNMAGGTWGSPLSGDGYTWSRGYTWSQGYTWSRAYTWSQGYTWSRGYTWSQGYTWSRNTAWSQGYTWSRTLPWWGLTSMGVLYWRPASIESWIPNE
jgi:subtilisin family serine protease